MSNNKQSQLPEPYKATPSGGNDSLKVYIPERVWGDLCDAEKKHTIKGIAEMLLDWTYIPTGEDKFLAESKIKKERDDVVAQAPNPSNNWNQRQRILYTIFRDQKNNRYALLALKYFPKHAEGKYKDEYNNTKRYARKNGVKAIAGNMDNYQDQFGKIIDLAKDIEEQQKIIIEERKQLEIEKQAKKVAEIISVAQDSKENQEWLGMDSCIDLFYGAKSQEDIDTLKEMITEDADRITPAALSQIPDDKLRTFVAETLKKHQAQSNENAILITGSTNTK